MLACLYLFCHIDRANIGNAKIEGMIEDLGMTGVQYNTVLSICKSKLKPRPPSLFAGVGIGTDELYYSFHTLCSIRSSQQHAAQEIQATIDVHWHPYPLLGYHNDMYWSGSAFW